MEVLSERTLPDPIIESPKRAWPKGTPGNPPNYTKKVLITITKSPTKTRKTEISPKKPGILMDQLDLIRRRRTASTQNMKTMPSKL
jgi:hypothetical protein